MPEAHAVQEVGTRLQKDGELGMASAMHRRLRIFPAPFHGVSTKRLDHCLSWFLRPGQARRSDADGLQTLSGQSACGSCEHARRQIIDAPSPSGTIGNGRERLRQCWSHMSRTPSSGTASHVRKA